MLNNLNLGGRGNVSCLVITCVCLFLVLLIYNLDGDHSSVQNAVHSFTIDRPEAKVLGAQVNNNQPMLDAFRADSVAYDLSRFNIDAMTYRQVRLTLHSYLDNTDWFCKRKLRMGHVDDGGWEICDDDWARPLPPCLIYSFGIRNDWSFDDDASELYRCHVYSFDPSMKDKNHNRSALVHFHRWGLLDKNGVSEKGWQMYSLADIRSRLGHSSTKIDVLKMDIEKSEWPTLTQLLETGQLNDVRQLLVEFHTVKLDHDTYYGGLKILQGLEQVGFRKFYVHKNPVCFEEIEGFPIVRTRCYEVHFVKIK